MNDRVSISEAARRLGLNKSTVSRQATRGALVGDDGLISLAAYQSWRSGDRDEAKAPATTGAGGDGGGGAGERPQSGYMGSKARREAAQARLAELELATKEGDLVDREAYHTALFDAGRRLRDGLQQLSLKLATELAAFTDPADIRSILDREHTALLQRFADDFARKVKSADE